MRSTLVRRAHAVLTAAAVLVALPAGSQASPGRSFAVVAPPVALPLLLTRGGGRERARLELPAVGETIILGAGRELTFLANALVPATLQVERETHLVTVALDAARCQAGMDAKARLLRRLHVYGSDGEEIASLEVSASLDVYGLADERPHVTLEASTARALGAFAGVLAGAELAREIPIATPAFPLQLAAAGTSLSIYAHDGALSGELRLEKRLSPGAVRGETATRVALQLFDDEGRRCGDLVTHVEGRAGDPDRWEERTEGAPRASIRWTRSGAGWTGALRVAAAAAPSPCRPARALVTLGDATSPFVVQASGAIAFAAEKAAGAATKASVRLEP